MNKSIKTNDAKYEYELETKDLCQYFPFEKKTFGGVKSYVKAVDHVSLSIKKGRGSWPGGRIRMRQNNIRQNSLASH